MSRSEGIHLVNRIDLFRIAPSVCSFSFWHMANMYDFDYELLTASEHVCPEADIYKQSKRLFAARKHTI